MPAAAVIPAPIAYIKVVAVKKLVVEFVCHAVGSSLAMLTDMIVGRPTGGLSLSEAAQLISHRGALHRVSRWAGTFTLNKLECSKQAMFA